MGRVFFRLAATMAIICADVTFATAQRPIEIALYDLEQLYDTINLVHPLYDTSSNATKEQWSSKRYVTKIENSVAVIDSIAAPIIAIIGVESEQVVRDLVRESQMEYCYAYRPLSYYDKLECALLYQADYMTVESIEASNYMMRVVGVIDSIEVEFSITRRGSKLHTIADRTPNRLHIVMGNFTHGQLNRLGVEDPLQALAKQGLGDTYSDMGWYFNTRLGVATPTTGNYSIEGGIFNAEWLLISGLRQPLPTHFKGHYVGGYSSHLPTYIRINAHPAPKSADDDVYAKQAAQKR